MKDDPIWQSKEWKEARKKFLKDECQQCGSTEKLSLVHLWKPPRYQSIRMNIEKELVEKLVKDNKIDTFDPDTSNSDEIRNACPSCKSINIRKRKTKQPPFRCGRCSHEFEEPDTIIVRDEYLFQQMFNSWKDENLKDYQTEIDSKIKAIQKQYDEKYRSGEGTTTMCGKCSFLWTQKHMQLCEKCEKNYHKKRFNTCYECYKQDDLVICEKCEEIKIKPQPGDLNICEQCYEKMWQELTE